MPIAQVSLKPAGNCTTLLSLANGAVKNSPEWLEKQRLLLADMALHLLQTSVTPGDIDLEKLTNNLHAILTITDQFLPHAGLKQATESLYEPLS